MKFQNTKKRYKSFQRNKLSYIKGPKTNNNISIPPLKSEDKKYFQPIPSQYQMKGISE